ncbi:TPA: DUF1120 domain-containing protein [Klebsiella aerogenes]|uniref:DUF1120 domain-containing protein n=1 Tax=Klebsiella aerogenes TaxID=548 RepID=UPI00277E354A|nr:DUF1120 domain-containing protein [Klebsiella aerogenes]MEB5738577.1 DUF1120 domain-containing protein [Klebsiella aerogenes]HDT0776049.1 DUF1120 domain-containing protein [Klebsiella aerogenes]HDU6292177.1 DUF1120 domain-containing protein [Klebsiella aerogenes]
MEFKRTILASLVPIASALSLSAHAADSFNINVTGVISPAACEANITGGETIDYGTIHVSKLSADAVTVLPGKQTAFSITCDAPAKVGFRTVDNRAGSKMTSGESIMLDSGIAWALSNMNGLGSDAKGNHIGGWASNLMQLNSDISASPEVLVSNDSGQTWGAFPDPTAVFFFNDNRIYTIREPGTTVPGAFTTLTGTLAVQAVINPASTLDLSQPVTLDGSVTVEMVYL